MNSHKEEQISILVENQKAFNNTSSYSAVSLPLVELVFNNFIGFDLVTVKSLTGPVGANTRFLYTRFNSDSELNTVVSDISLELNKEIIIDISKNCGHAVNGSDQEDLIKEAMDRIDGEWIMAPGESKVPVRVSDNRWEWEFCKNSIVGKKSGYSYYPYIPFALVPGLSNTDGSSFGGIITRYGKHLNDSKCFVKCIKD